MISVLSTEDEPPQLAQSHASVLERRSSFEFVFDREDSQSSMISSYVACEKSSHSNVSTGSFNSGRTKNNVWSKDEDELLRSIVGQNGAKRWKYVTDLFNSRTAGRPRPMASIVQHWVRVLDPAKVQRKWSAEEDEQLLRAMKICPPRQWSKIAQLLEGRSDNQVVSRLRSLRKKPEVRGSLPDEYFP